MFRIKEYINLYISKQYVNIIMIMTSNAQESNIKFELKSVSV